MINTDFITARADAALFLAQCVESISGRLPRPEDMQEAMQNCKALVKLAAEYNGKGKYVLLSLARIANEEMAASVAAIKKIAEEKDFTTEEQLEDLDEFIQICMNEAEELGVMSAHSYQREQETNHE